MNDRRISIEKEMIKSDANYMIGMFFAIQQLLPQAQTPYYFFCIDFYSLIVHEAYHYYSTVEPELAKKFKQLYAADIMQSRQRIKMYDDTKLGIEGVGKTLIETITPKHREKLSETHRIKIPKRMWSDVSLYFIEGKAAPIGSTHLASFNMGIDIIRTFDKSSATGLGEGLGHFLVAISDAVAYVRLPQINVKTHDINSDKLYAKDRYGSSSKLINAGLSVIDMDLNFAALCLPNPTNFTTLFKWKFLMTYHALSSLTMLFESSHIDTIDPEIAGRIKVIVNSDLAMIFKSKGANALRNTLTHYRLDTRLDFRRLNSDPKLFFGIIEAALPEWSYAELVSYLDKQIINTLLNPLGAW